MVPTRRDGRFPSLQEIKRFRASDFTYRMRSVASVADERTRSESEATPSLVRSGDEVRRLALQLSCIFDQHDAIGGLCNLRSNALVSVVSCRWRCRRRQGYCGDTATAARNARPDEHS